MITKPSVFVLGAGASAPYGFPLGRDLINEVANGLATQLSPFEDDVCAAHRLVDEVRAFGHDLRTCGRSSIDAFLETRQEFLAVGKVAIARVMAEYETDSRLVQDYPQNGWYRYLFDKMYTASVDDFVKNRLKVVTFNFDRSFERALVLSLRSNYGITEEKAIDIARHIPVLHVHGQLGALWDTEGGIVRPYETLGPDPITRRNALRICADQIRIIHEEVEGPVLTAARKALRDAEMVCFLGFGYHETNLERLQVRKLGTHENTVVGTTFRMPAGEKEKARRGFPNITHYDHDVLNFLRETHFIHV